MLREDQLRWTFKLYDASGDGVLEQQEVDDHGHDVHHGVHHDHCDDLFQVLLIMQSIQGAFSREETGISRSFFKSLTDTSDPLPPCMYLGWTPHPRATLINSVAMLQNHWLLSLTPTYPP